MRKAAMAVIEWLCGARSGVRVNARRLDDARKQLQEERSKTDDEFERTAKSAGARAHTVMRSLTANRGKS